MGLYLFFAAAIRGPSNRTQHRRAMLACEEAEVVFLTRRGVTDEIEAEAAGTRAAGESIPMRLLWPLWLMYWTARLSLTHDIKRVHTSHTPQALVAARVVSIAGPTWVADIWDSPHLGQDLSVDRSSAADIVVWIYYVILLAVVRRTLADAELIICALAPGALDQYHVAYENDNVVAVPNGVNIDLVRSVDPYDFDDGRVHLVIVGSIRRERCVDHAVTAVRHLDERGHTVDLHLIGDATPDSFAEWIASVDSELERCCIHQHGHLDHEDALAHVIGADIGLCLLSPTVDNYEYAYPIKILEYLAAGTAVVATQTTGTTQLLNEGGGLLVHPQTPSQVATTLESLISQPDRIVDYGDQAQLIAKRYDWERIDTEIQSALAHLG